MILCQLYTKENRTVHTNKEAIKYVCFFPVQHSTIIANPTPAPNNENQGKVFWKKKRDKAKSATKNKAKNT